MSTLDLTVCLRLSVCLLLDTQLVPEVLSGEWVEGSVKVGATVRAEGRNAGVRGSGEDGGEPKGRAEGKDAAHSFKQKEEA